ncbi:MAG: amidase family protein [Pseudomonadota bacterium]
MILNRRRLMQTTAAALTVGASVAKTSFAQTPKSASDLPFASANEALAALQNKSVSSRELTELCFNRIDQTQDSVNALAILRREEALAEAIRVDEARANGETLGALAGLPITLKESFDVAGLQTTWGSPDAPRTPLTEHSAVAARLIAADGIILGKTNVSLMLADWDGNNPVYGQTLNPWNLDRVAGGSSAGAAAALSAGLSFLDVGSDLGGSIRQPAANCGIYGHKPTAGIVSQRGHVPSIAPPFMRAVMAEIDSLTEMPRAGPMTRSADDLVTALNVIGGPDGAASKALSYRVPQARHKALKDFKVGFAMAHPDGPLDTGSADVLDSLIQSLDGKVASLKQGWPDGVDPRRQRDLRHYFRATISTMMSMPDVIAEREAVGFEDGPSWETGSYDGAFNQGFADRRAAFVRMETERLALRAAWQHYFSEFDVFLMPVQTKTARVPGGLTTEDALETHLWAAAATLTGLPATAAPAGIAAVGLPVGLQILGPYYEDATPIWFAKALADAGIGGYQRPPFTV